MRGGNLTQGRNDATDGDEKTGGRIVQPQRGDMFIAAQYVYPRTPAERNMAS